jgi:chemotaxis protein CheX
MPKLQIELITPFIDGARETFRAMASVQIRRKDVFLKRGHEMYGAYSGVIGLSGTTTGTCAVSLTAPLAELCVRRMLGLPEDAPVEAGDVRDGVGELVNMIAGRAKAILAESKYTFDITLPTIISGEKHELYLRRKADCVVVLFETDSDHTFALDVCVAAPAK